MRFTVLSDEGDRLGVVAFEGGRFVTEARLVRATLERVSADTAMRFVRDPDDDET